LAGIYIGLNVSVHVLLPNAYSLWKCARPLIYLFIYFIRLKWVSVLQSDAGKFG
jgi:hypothetical protein